MDRLVECHLVREDQACLVPVSDWPMRALVRAKYRPYHDREILQAESGLAEAILAAIDAKGPLSSLEFEDRQRVGDNNSWYGQTRTKRILRSLLDTDPARTGHGTVATYSRGHHLEQLRRQCAE